MSNNPWPFVVVALTSLGFLANSMAQQRSPSGQDVGNPSPYGAPPSTGFDAILYDSNPRFDDSTTSGQRPTSSWDSSTSSSVDGQARLTLPPNTASLGTDFRFEVPPSGSISNVRESIDNVISGQPNMSDRYRQPYASEARLGTELINETSTSNPAAAGNSAVAPIYGSPAGSTDNRSAYGIPFDSSPRVAQNTNRFGDDSQRRRGMTRPGSSFDAGLDNRRTGNGMTLPPNTVLPPRTVGDSRGLNEPLFPKETVSTSILSDPPMIRPNQSQGFGQRDGFGTRQEGITRPPVGANDSFSPNLPNNAVRGNARLGDDSSTEKSTADLNDGQSTKAQNETEGKPVKTVLPFWPTFALFASLVANLFFGWFAWDTHSRYQDFVEEMSENDMRFERQKRRLRSESRSRDERRPRRTREQEEAEFLQGGLEV